MTSQPLSMRRNFSLTVLGNVVYALGLWGVLALLAKLGSPELVGRYAIGSLIVGPVMMFTNLELRSVLATDAHGAHEFGEYLGLRLGSVTVAMLVIIGIAAVGYGRQQILVVAVFGLMRAVESTSDIFHGFAQKHDRMDLVSFSLILKAVLGLLLFGVGFTAMHSLPLGMLALAAGWALILFGFDIPRARTLMRAVTPQQAPRAPSLRPRWPKAAMLAIIRLTWPLGLVMLLNQLRNTIPRAVLESGYGEQTLGIFSALAYLVIAGNTVAMAMSQSSIARMSRLYAAGDRAGFGRIVGRLMLLGVGLGLAGVAVAALWGRQLLTLFYTPEYASHADDLVLIMAAGGVINLGSLLGAPATAMRAFKAQLAVHLANAAVLTALALLLIPGSGLQGAAWAMLGGGVWVTIGHVVIYWRGTRPGRWSPSLGPAVPAAEKGRTG